MVTSFEGYSQREQEIRIYYITLKILETFHWQGREKHKSTNKIFYSILYKCCDYPLAKKSSISMI